MKIPSPHDCGLPEQFDNWRDGQEEAIDVAVTSKKRVIALAAPTGFGKSPAVVASALLSKLPTCIVTGTRALEDQYMSEFSSIGMVDIRGRRNYKCGYKDGYTCEDGYAYRCPFKGSISCPSSRAEMRAATSSLVVTNYDKWTSARKFGQGMAHFQQVIFDEGHEAPEALARAMQITLHYKEIEDTLKFSFPPHEDRWSLWKWKSWAANARQATSEAYREALIRCSSTHDPKPTWVRHLNHMKQLGQRLLTLSTCDPKDWIVDELDEGYQFDPIWPARYAEAALLLRIPKIIILSATLRPKTLTILGIDKEDYDFKEFDSTFDRNRCPIYYIPIMRVDAKADDLRPLWVKLDQIAARRRDRKGIVHTISYARRDGIVQTSRFADKMIINHRGEPATGIIQQFKSSPPGIILVSPSVGTGYDFPRSDCEWQFLCKIPFPDSRAKIIKERQQRDKEYGPYIASQYMVQAFGRGMRDKGDRCEGFIGDMHLDWFMRRYGHLFPRYFHSFFRRVDRLPDPLEKL